MKSLSLPLLAALALAAPALASPPPLPVAITFLPGSADAEAMREDLIEAGWFGRTASTLDPGAVAACAGKDAACVRALTHPTRGKTAPEVIVLLAPEGGKTRMTCVGPGETSRDPVKQSVLIDLAVRARDDRDKAAGCIISAAAESGW